MVHPTPMHRLPRRGQSRRLRKLNIREEQAAPTAHTKAAETEPVSEHEVQKRLPDSEDTEMTDVGITQNEPTNPKSWIAIARSHSLSDDPKATDEEVLQRSRVRIEYRFVWNRKIASDVMYTTGEKIRTAKFAFQTMKLGFMGKYPRMWEHTSELLTTQFQNSVLLCQQVKETDTRKWIRMIPTMPGTYNSWYNTHVKSGLNDNKTLRIEVHVDDWRPAERLEEDGTWVEEERPAEPAWDVEYQSLEDSYAGWPIYDEDGQVGDEVEDEAEFEFYQSTLEFFPEHKVFSKTQRKMIKKGRATVKDGRVVPKKRRPQKNAEAQKNDEAQQLVLPFRPAA